MDDQDAVILIDAAQRGEPPGTVYLIEADAVDMDRLSAEPPDVHSMNPLAALRLVRALGGEPRRLYVVGCEPSVLETEELGLSEPVRAAVPGAAAMVEELVRELIETRGSVSSIETNAIALKMLT
jgi:hydrogenase maturation protease